MHTSEEWNALCLQNTLYMHDIFKKTENKDYEEEEGEERNLDESCKVQFNSNV